MEQSAILHLQTTSNMVEMNKELQEQNLNNPLFLAPDNFKMHDLEGHMQFRTNYRFKFKTTNINDFISYAEEYIENGSKCFVDADRMTAKAFFDLGNKLHAQHQDHTGHLELKRLSDYKKLLDIDEMHLSQKDAGNFIEDFYENVKCFTKDGVEMPASVAAQSIYDMTIEQAKTIKSKVANLGESLSTMEKIEAANQDKICAGFVFKCIPYMGLDEREFQVRLSILTGGERPKISLKVINIEKHQEQMSEEFRDQLVRAFKGSEMKTFIGNQ